MMRAFAGVGFVIVLSCLVFGQSTPSFDVVEIHLKPHTSNLVTSGGVLRGGRFDVRNATMLDLIVMAYELDADRVLGGPNWLETERFDIFAGAPQTTPPETINLMLQTMLAERFKLALHKETKSLPGFALTTGNGKHKLKPGTGEGSSGCSMMVKPTTTGASSMVISCRNATLERLTQALHDLAPDYVTSPVTDVTGLTGSWAFDLTWTRRGQLVQAGSDGINLFDAIDKQLGLRLEARQVPTSVLVVDRVNQQPTDNPSGVAPPSPPGEFEVAEVKLSPPGTRPREAYMPGGRLDFQGLTLKRLILLAWDLNNDEMLTGGPKWLDETQYSVMAKVSTVAAGNGYQMDRDDVRPMLRALLVERFKLTTHTEDRPVSVYALVATKPKLTKADPSNRTGWKNGPAPNAPDPRNGNPILSRVITCRNMTMAQFAENLPRIAPGYIHNPVLDESGIEGNWDFTFTFTPVGSLDARVGGGTGAAGGAMPAASDPNGAVSVFDALSKQLGLKLETRKHPMPVLVIDHVEEKPLDN